jgi:hypothetical protein
MKRDQIDGFLNTFVTCAQSKHGTSNGLSYSAGFFQSLLGSVLADLPAHKQMEVIQVLVQRSLED